MLSPNKIILEDLAAVKNLLNIKQFDKMNIIGNRILQNLYAINEKDMMIIGIIIKEISMDLQVIQALNNRRPKSSQKKQSQQTWSDEINIVLPFAAACIEAISLNLNNKFSYSDCWIAYFDFQDKIKKFQIAPDERDKYGENHEFSKLATINYLKYLSMNKSLILKRSIHPIQQTRIELALIVNLHGGKIAAIGYLILRAFEHATRFAIFGKLDDETYNSFINSNMDSIDEIIELIEKSDESTTLEKATRLIGDLMFSYRDYFGKYGELSLQPIRRSASFIRCSRENTKNN